MFEPGEEYANMVNPKIAAIANSGLLKFIEAFITIGANNME